MQFVGYKWESYCIAPCFLHGGELSHALYLIPTISLTNPSCYLLLIVELEFFPSVILRSCSAWIDISKPYPHVCSGFVNPLRADSVDLAYITPVCDVSYKRVVGLEA